MRVIDDVKLDFSDVLILPKRSTLLSRKDVDLTRTYKFKHSMNQWTGVPIIASNMDGVGTISMAKALQKHSLMTVLTKTHTIEDLKKHSSLFISEQKDEFKNGLDQNFFSISAGINSEDINKLYEILHFFPSIRFITIDVANGYSEHFSKYVNQIRNDFPSKIIIAGNVVTAEMTQELILQGADIVKVGIGPGSACTTRIQTGVGYPQLSAIIECADAAHGLGAHIIADGGCTSPSDIAKAFGAGADFVMLGGMLAGHEEGEQEIYKKHFLTNEVGEDSTLFIEEKKFVKFYGMSSEEAMNKYSGGVAEYRSSEGRIVEIPYKSSLDETIRDILGGLRSTCTYVGAPTLKQLSKCTTFIKVHNQYNKIFE